MEEKKDTYVFLVKKFLQVIIIIALLEMLINWIYSYCIFPLLRNNIGGPFFESIGKSRYGSGFLISLLFIMISGAILSFFPNMISAPLYHLMDSYFGRILPGNIGNIFNNTGKEIATLYYFGCILIVILLVLISIMPYIIGAIHFSKMIHREMKKRIEEDKEKHREYERKRSLMLSDIAHDLKTPITTISGYAQALRDDMVKDPIKKKQYFDAICNKSQRMDDLISVLFEYVKIDSDGFKLYKESIDIGEILRENIALFYADFERNGIELDIDIPENSIMWQLDRIQFSRALSNLLSNDLRHVGTGNTVIIRMEYDEEIERLKIILADTGKQIPNDVAMHIFEPFVMGDTSRSSRGGSGLGLSISSKIVKMHGGILVLDRNSTEEYTKAFVIILKK